MRVKVIEDIDVEWSNLLVNLKDLIGKQPASLDVVLFLIGVQELGKGNRYFSKEEKQDLMHIGICKVLSLSGFYELEGLDKDGWPHWKSVKKLPNVTIKEQEKLLKMHILEYFQNL